MTIFSFNDNHCLFSLRDKMIKYFNEKKIIEENYQEHIPKNIKR